MNSFLERCKEQAIKNLGVTVDNAINLYQEGKQRPFMVFAYANEIREHFKNGNVSLCAIINAKTPQPVPISRIFPSPGGEAHAPSNMASVPTRWVLRSSSTSNCLKWNAIGDLQVNLNQSFRCFDQKLFFLSVDLLNDIIYNWYQYLFFAVANLEQ